MDNLKHELDVVALKSARMSKTQLNTGRVQVGDLREVARLELLELLDRLLFSSSSEKLNFFPQVSWYQSSCMGFRPYRPPRTYC